jgi:hypothetical protein
MGVEAPDGGFVRDAGENLDEAFSGFEERSFERRAETSAEAPLFPTDAGAGAYPLVPLQRLQSPGIRHRR